MQRKHTFIVTAVAAVASMGLIAGCASLPSSAELDVQALAMIKASFRDQGIAKVDRLNQIGRAHV